MRDLKGVFFSATNDSTNYREAAAPCKPAVKAASVPRLPRFQRFTRIGSFLLLRENVARSFIRSYDGTARISARGSDPEAFLYIVFVILSSFARNVSILILILARTGEYQSRTLFRIS